MAIPNGQFGFNDVNNELGRPWNQQIHMGDAQVRQLAGVGSSGQWGVNNLLGKSWVSFSPAGGTIYASGTPAQVWLYCSQSAVWNWTLVSGTGGTALYPSGTSAGSIYFQCSAPRFQTRRCVYNVTGSANGVSRSWTLSLTGVGPDAQNPE